MTAWAGDGDWRTRDGSTHADALESEQRLRRLVERICGGEEQALVALYDATLDRVFSLALLITRNSETAEEVTEDVYWQAWRQARRFDPERGKVMSWLTTMTRTRAIDHCRRDAPAAALKFDHELWQHNASPANEPSDLCEATERSHALHTAVARLDQVQRQLLGLAYFRGLTHEDIAAETGLPIGTVKSHIRRALLRLRRGLAKQLAAFDGDRQ